MQETYLIVDAMNVIGSRPDGWWRDRHKAIRRFVQLLQKFAQQRRFKITVVIDGRPLPDLPEGSYASVEVLYARRAGPNAADDRIVELVEQHTERRSLVVATSDAGLSARVRDLGANVHGAGWLLDQLDRTAK